MSEPDSSSVAPKVKTKAKQRYLKAKRERRKKRLASAPKPKNPNYGQFSERDAEEDNEGDEAQNDEQVVRDEDDMDQETGPLPMDDEEPAESPAPQEKSKKEKRPKKRAKKTDSQPESSPPLPAIEEAPLDAGDVMEVDIPIEPSEPALAAFPLPTAPDPPSKAQLASQGLDPAFLKADIIDPSLTQPVDSVDLSDRMKTRLSELGIESLFAVQTSLLPFLLDSRYRRLYVPYDPAPDAAISAPTGSGKTLAYVIPIVEMLASRTLTMLRALIVLPTRDLVNQVRETFELVAKGRGLKIASTTGQHSFAHEQNSIVESSTPILMGGSSKVDILITTPGRLTDHLDGTPNFTLQHLRFLVIDEADRLLASSFQNWLERVLSAISDSPHLKGSAQKYPSLIPRHDFPAPTHYQLLPESELNFLSIDQPQPSCQKLLFSATLTSDPGKVRKLNLRDVRYFIVKGADKQLGEDEAEQFEMPASLSENYVVTTTELKPLVLFHIVLEHRIRNALVFTKSTESTGRLLRLWENFEAKRLAGSTQYGTTEAQSPIVAKAFSSDLTPAQRKSILSNFRNGVVSILICSDLISRGIDVPSITHVISYDTPLDIRKYVHRSGRTARAGREGSAWTLLEAQEARHFKIMLKEVGHLTRVKKVRIGEDKLVGIRPFYQDALGELQAST